MRNGFFALLLAALALALSASSAFADRPPTTEDLDGDGIAWIDDICPDVAGLTPYFGCADVNPDGDRLSGLDDPCPWVPNNALPCIAYPDTDYDTVPNRVDVCGSVPGMLPLKGCPDPQPYDLDGDGIANATDACAEQPGIASKSGCPKYHPDVDSDTDGDGIAWIDDSCAGMAGPTSFYGCPANGDRDKDGLSDGDDPCPFTPGTACTPSADSDHDGVPNALDACTSTPGMRPWNGCLTPTPDNTDGDGFIDGDACPTMPGGIPDGCPLPLTPDTDDRDGDGVANYLDVCSEPARNASGCPKSTPGDSDGDGIANADDACPDDVGISFRDGCPLVPLDNTDNDGDGLPNRRDVCPDVPAAHASGCPMPTAGDRDGDGVLDTADACPRDAGLLTTGCPNKPLDNTDNDGDGLPNRHDVCPDVPASTESGCPMPAEPRAPQPDTPSSGAPAPGETPPGAPAPDENPPARASGVVGVSTTRTGIRLSVRNVVSGSTLKVRCKGKACPANLRKGVIKRNVSGTVKLDSLVKRRLPAGTVLTIAVSKPGTATVTTKVTIRKGKQPLVKTS